MTQQPDALAGLSLERAIHLRWALRDIKAKRTKVAPVSPDDLQNLVELRLIEMRNELPVLTVEGLRVLE
jgi:hypothetical protein